MSDQTLRRRERAWQQNPDDPDARARYVHALGVEHALAELARLGMYPELGELDALGNADAFESALLAFVHLVSARRKMQTGAHQCCDVATCLASLALKRGRRYVGIFDAGRVLCFVDLKGGDVKGSPTRRGDVLRAASVTGPTAHTRGSIFDGNGGALALDGNGIAVELGVIYECHICHGWHAGQARSPRSCEEKP